MTTLDLRAVDELCRLAVAARRLGCHVHLTGADPTLRSLLDLAGVDDLLPGLLGDSSTGEYHPDRRRSTMTDVSLSASTPTVDEFEAHRRQLTGYCYRMLGSGAEAEDAVQETMLRAWQAADRFEGRSSVTTWLYRIATNVCTDMGRSPQRRARPVDLGPARPPDPAHLVDVLPDGRWITPIADSSVIDLDGDPAEVTAARDTIRLAFVSALQHLPAKQRAVLVLCDVLRWPAVDAAELLDTSTASVNSALQPRPLDPRVGSGR